MGLALFMAINSVSGSGMWPAMTSYASTAKVNATTLNVRSGPGTSYSVAGKLTNGTTVTILGETTGTDGKTWCKIQFTGSTGSQSIGYVLSSYLKSPTAYTTNMNFENYLNSQGFPESYKEGLRQLHAEYPNWVFTAQHTNLNWEDVIDNESIVGRNLVYSSSLSSWKSTADGAYNWDTSTWPGFDSSSYVAASDQIIRYYMDPRNFMDDKYVFQFLVHNYDPLAQTAEGLSAMVKGTFLEGSAAVSGMGSSGTSSGPGASSSDTSLTGPGVSSSGTSNSSSSGSSLSGPGASSPGTSNSSSSDSSLSGPGVSSSGSSSSASLGGPGSTGSSVNSGSGDTSLSGPGVSGSGSSSSGTGSVSLEGPTGTGNSGVSLQGPTASISKKETNRVMTAVGPGVSSSGSSSAPEAAYTDILMSAAAQSGVNPYVLAAMILQEQGTQGTGKCISGAVPGYKGYYNFFNIEAYQSGSMDAVSRGLWYASQSGSYERPWNSVDSSIVGGAVYYGTNYVSVGQDTFYLKKFNVQGSNLYKHQYMTNVQAAASEGARLAEAYGDELKKTALEFKIPVFLNMPETACAKPTTDGSPNNKLSGLGVDGFAITPTFNRDTTSYDLIVDPSVSEVKVNAVPLSSTASISGTGSIQLQSGNNEIKVSVTAQNGDVRVYQIHVVRQENGPTHNSSLGSGVSGSSGYGPGYSSASPQTTTSSSGTAAGTTSSSGTSSGDLSNYGPGVTGSSETTSSTGSGPGTTGSTTVEIGSGPGVSSDSASSSENHSGPGGSNVTIIR